MSSVSILGGAGTLPNWQNSLFTLRYRLTYLCTKGDNFVIRLRRFYPDGTRRFEVRSKRGRTGVFEFRLVDRKQIIIAGPHILNIETAVAIGLESAVARVIGGILLCRQQHRDAWNRAIPQFDVSLHPASGIAR